MTHPLTRAQYYRWRDQFLANAHQIFINPARQDKQLVWENTCLCKMIGALTVELKNRRVVAMKGRASAAVTERNLLLLERINEIKAEHLCWSYRRCWAHLRYVDGLNVNQKRILRLMWLQGLLVKPDCRLRTIRTLV